MIKSSLYLVTGFNSFSNFIHKYITVAMRYLDNENQSNICPVQKIN